MLLTPLHPDFQVKTKLKEHFKSLKEQMEMNNEKRKVVELEFFTIHSSLFTLSMAHETTI